MGKYANANSMHQVLSFVLILSSTLGFLLTQLGCTTLPSGAYDCSASSSIPPWLLPYIVVIGGLVGATKIIMGLMRDGPAGMFKVQPPVADQTKTIVVATPTDTSVKVKVDSNVTNMVRPEDIRP